MFCLSDNSIRKTTYMHPHATGRSNFRFQLTGLFLIFGTQDISGQFLPFRRGSSLFYDVLIGSPPPPFFLDICGYAVCLREKPMEFLRKRSL